MTSSPDLTPENKILRQQAENLKKDFATLYEKWHYMFTYEEAALTSVYLNLIGGLKFQLFRSQTDLAMLKKKIQLVQAYFNRNVTPDWPVIEHTLRQEFAAYQQKLEEEAKKLAAAKEYLKKGFLNDTESVQLKEVYRLLVKKLHPDLNPNQSENERELFLRVQAAYQLCDLATLNEILLLTDYETPVELLPVSDLKAKVEDLTNKLNDLQKKTDALNRQFPFAFREKLQDEEWIAAEKESLNQQIALIEKELAEKNEFLLLLKSWKPELLH